MSDPITMDQERVTDPETPTAPEDGASFGEILSQYEQSHLRRPEGGGGREGQVVAITADAVFLDIGLKTEGMLPAASLRDAAGNMTVKPGDAVQVAIKGRDGDYYELSLVKVERPKDWSSLERAFAAKSPIGGVVNAVVKGGFSVDVGVRAFMPASRSGARDQAEMEKLVGQEIKCRIIKLDVADEDVVVDRRAVLEEEEARAREERFAAMREGEVLQGTVRSLTDYGAFVDIGGFDGLLHVADISWARVNKPSDVLAVGQQIEVRVLKADAKKRRLSLGLKQLQQHPWELAGDKYKSGEKVRGTVTRVTDFGAFVELEPGVEGLVHFSEMSWSKKARKPADVVKPGDSVEVMVLGANPAERRIALGLKQALGDPWADAAAQFPQETTVEGEVVSLQKFGAFVKLAEDIEGMVHIGDISAEKRINHPQDVLKIGQKVKAKVLEIDAGKRRIRLGMKQLVPTSLDEYLGEHKEGDLVTGRVADVSRGRIKVELGEGVHGYCQGGPETAGSAGQSGAPQADLPALSSMLAARWKGGGRQDAGQDEPVRPGQIRSFRILKLDAGAKRIDLEVAG